MTATSFIANGVGRAVDPKKPMPKWLTLLTEGQEAWKKSQKDKRFPKQLDHNARSLRIQITKALEAAGEEEDPNAKKEAIRDITNLLKDTSLQNKIDSCVRWLILYGLVESEIGDDPDDLDIEVVKMLVDAEAFLAFENPHTTLDKLGQPQPTANTIWEIKCADKKTHWQQKKRSTPFHTAAANGNAKALRHMVESLEKYCDIEKQKEERKETAYERPMFFRLSTTRDPVLAILRMADSSTRETALQRAAKAESKKGKLDTLDVLLAYPRIAAAPDTTFREALDSGAADVVERFLQHPELVNTFVTSDNIIHAMGKITRQQGQEHADGNNTRIRIIHLLIEHAKTDKVFNRDVVEKIIALNLTEVWMDKRPKQLKLKGYHPLHLAVMHQNLEFVKMFVDEYNDTVTEQANIPETDTKAYYPLWFNNRKWDKSKSEWVKRSGSTDIRTELVIATIKQTDKMHNLSDILQRSDARELCFDISLFNSKSYRLYDFVRSLIAHNENETLLEYEPTIKYTRFPPMDLHPDDKEVFGEPVQYDHREVFDVLDWLRSVKKVKSVIELRVPDRLVNPHNEDKIAKVVKDFGVEILNWRFLDLSLSGFADVRTKIRGLHLYASGKRAVISHWMSDKGLECFTKLAFLRIHVVQETMTKTSCDRTCRLIRKELQALLGRLRNKREFTLDYEVNSQPWNPKHDVLADLGELAQRAFPTLSQFILNYRTHVTKHPPPKGFTPTKIAIIDNGIMSMSPATHDNLKHHKRPRTTRLPEPRGTPPTDAAQFRTQGGAWAKPASNVNFERSTARTGESSAEETDDDDDNNSINNGQDNSQGDLSNQKQHDKGKDPRTLWSRIKLGRSFVDDDFQVSPWLFASDPHGTQMANLICAIDPACELYVAKVTDGRDGVTPQRVARAIEWARRQKVDIISMSFAILETITALDEAVFEAGSEGIIMLCSTHDEGSNVGRAWPATLAPTFAVTACDEYGTLYRAMKDDSFRYMLQGLNIAAGVIHFLDSADRISGSSVATAVAAGLSSLILSCLRLANPEQEFKGLYRTKMVEEKLDSMLANTESKYVIMEKFGGIDKRMKTGEPIYADAIIEKEFKV